MLQVLLLILKIAGIILAVLLGIIIVIVGFLLFAPVCYTLEAKYFDKAEVKFKAEWLAFIFRFSVLYDEALRMKLKFLMFSLYDSEKTKEKVKAAKYTENSEKKGEKQSVFDEKVNDKESDKESFFNEDFSKEEFLRNEVPKKEALEEKVIGEEVKNKFKGIADKSISLKNTFKEKKNYFKEVLQDEENKELVCFLWGNIRKLIKKIKPKKYRIYIRYGFEDSEDTGWLAVRLAVLYGLLGIDAELIPDFEQSVFEGEVMLKGRFRLFGVLKIAGKVYFNGLVQKKLFKK